MTTEQIQKELFALRDQAYGDFMSPLMPTVDKNMVIGVRTPALRSLARRIGKEADTAGFLADLPHHYFEENQLHAFLIAEIKDFESCLEAVIRFLPYVDNWATCDQLTPKVFRKKKEQLLPHIRLWLDSDRPYTIRFGLKMLMSHFLDEAFKPEYPEWAAGVRSEEYYVNMMIAWYFATALAKQYDAVLPFLETERLDRWTHNKTIRKAVESYRITPEQKQYLRTLKR